jgi:ribosomal protein S18 acetylase RimI-like enzyme
MAHRRPPDGEAARAAEVEETDLAGFARVSEATIREQGYGSDPALVVQLLELARRVADVVPARVFAALDDGLPVAVACLYQEGPVAQVEDVATLPEHRGRGLARAVVSRCVAEARSAGAELVFLVADDDDWPKALYAKLGFEAVAAEHMAGRPGLAAQA